MDYTESVGKAKNYINEHLSEELTAEKISAGVGYSLFHFSRVFKEYTGKSLMRYVREKRLDIAATEMQTGAHAVDVAVKYGFETVSGFSRAYKRKFGERPTGKTSA